MTSVIRERVTVKLIIVLIITCLKRLLCLLRRKPRDEFILSTFTSRANFFLIVERTIIFYVVERFIDTRDYRL